MADDQQFSYRYTEGDLLKELEQYIRSTYGQHYVGEGDIQTVDFWYSLGSLGTTARDNAIKYLARFGKKEGMNRKDILKALHFTLLVLYDSDKKAARAARKLNKPDNFDTME